MFCIEKVVNGVVIKERVLCESDMCDCHKEVYFNKYCEYCKYSNVSEKNEACNECVATPVNLYSHKPVKCEEKE